MKRYCDSPIFATALIVFALFFSCFSSGAGAAEIIVPKDHAHIQDAITAAQDGDIVTVETGTYQETFTLKSGVEVRGRETARTILDGGGSGTIVTAGTITAAIRNFTFVNALIGIQVSGSAIDITNNVFAVGTTNNGTAIRILSSPDTTIINNTFYGNNTAVSRDGDIAIINNIFANSLTVAIADTSLLSKNTGTNAFFNNSATGPTGTWYIYGDPLFVDPANADPAKRDFHLKENSPCIDAGDPGFIYYDIIDGTRNDIGAYGGPAADPIPFPVAGLTISSTTANSIDLTWSPNYSYLVTSESTTPGGYFVYYGYAPGDYSGTDANSGQELSPIDVGTDTSYTLMDLNPLLRIPAAPVLDQPIVGDTTLTLKWSAISNAAGYNVHYGKTSPGEFTIDAGIATSCTLTGLINGQDYHMAVTAYAPAKYYIVVTAYDSMFVDTATTPEHESVYSSEVSTQLGPLLESAQSNIQTEKPDAIVQYPGLPNSGGHCFIATAAYGSYVAPEVQVLRSFRDRYLLTNSPGRQFVQWYYQYGPSAAALLNAHPTYKPIVRAALMPFVGAAFMVTNVPPLFSAGVLLMIGFAIAFGLMKKRFSERRVPR